MTRATGPADVPATAARLPRPRNPDEEPADSRARILEAAAQCIAESGVEGVRMAGIAAAAGVSTALLHYHFATKEALFERVLRHSYESSTLLDLAAMRDGGLGAAERLAAYLNRCIPSDDLLHRDLLLWQEFGAMSPRYPAMADVTSEMFQGDVDRVASIIRDGVGEGIFHDCDAELVARAAVALCDGLNTRVLAGDPTTTLAESRHVIATVVADLLGADAPLPLEPPAGAPSSTSRSPHLREAQP
jgi:AcrR family transcriptional regulator